MILKELAARAGFTVLTPGPGLDAEITACYVGDLLSWVMSRAPSGCVWITIMSNVNVAAVALLAETACVLLAEQVRPDPDLTKKAAENGVTLLSAPMGAYEAACTIYSLLKEHEQTQVT